MCCLLQGGSARKGSGDSVRVNGSLRDMSPLTSVRLGSGREKLGSGREVSGTPSGAAACAVHRHTSHCFQFDQKPNLLIHTDSPIPGLYHCVDGCIHLCCTLPPPVL